MHLTDQIQEFNSEVVTGNIKLFDCEGEYKFFWFAPISTYFISHQSLTHIHSRSFSISPVLTPSLCPLHQFGNAPDCWLKSAEHPTQSLSSLWSRPSLHPLHSRQAPLHSMSPAPSWEAHWWPATVWLFPLGEGRRGGASCAALNPPPHIECGLAGVNIQHFAPHEWAAKDPR